MAEEKLFAYRRDYEALREKLLKPSEHAIPISSVAFCVAKEDSIQITDEDGKVSRHTRAEAVKILDQRISLIDSFFKAEPPKAEAPEEEPKELIEPWTAEDEKIFSQRGGRRIAHVPTSKRDTPEATAAPVKREYPVKSQVVERNPTGQVTDPADRMLAKQVKESLFIRERH